MENGKEEHRSQREDMVPDDSDDIDRHETSGDS
jgi:hypothetical protein